MRGILHQDILELGMQLLNPVSLFIYQQILLLTLLFKVGQLQNLPLNFLYMVRLLLPQLILSNQSLNIFFTILSLFLNGSYPFALQVLNLSELIFKGKFYLIQDYGDFYQLFS